MELLTAADFLFPAELPVPAMHHLLNKNGLPVLLPEVLMIFLLFPAAQKENPDLPVIFPRFFGFSSLHIQAFLQYLDSNPHSRFCDYILCSLLFLFFFLQDKPYTSLFDKFLLFSPVFYNIFWIKTAIIQRQPADSLSWFRC